MTVGGPVFLTAPRGILGSFLVRELLSRGAPEVRCGVRDPAAASQLDSLGAIPVRFDLEDGNTYRAALDGISTLVIIPPVQVEDMDKDLEVLLEAAATSGCLERVVRVSLANAGPEASFEWGRLHGAADRAVEKFCSARGIECCIVRSAPLLQSFALLHRWSIDAEATIYAPLGQAKVAFVDAADVAAAVAVIATRGAGKGVTSLTVTGPAAVSGEDIARAMGSAMGREGHYRSVTETAARHGMTGAGWPEYLVDRTEGIHAAYRRGEFEAVSRDPQEKLGLDAPRDVGTFFRDLLGQ